MLIVPVCINIALLLLLKTRLWYWERKPGLNFFCLSSHNNPRFSDEGQKDTFTNFENIGLQSPGDCLGDRGKKLRSLESHANQPASSI